MLTYFTGTLDLEIPEYVNINHDAAARRVELSVKDRNERNQREMWGMEPSEQPLERPDRELTDHRNHMVVPQ